MAIKRSFGGASIRKPGAYSRNKVDNSGGAPLGANDALFIYGEAAKGKPGSSEGVQEFGAAQVDQLVEKYGSGPIVESALAAIRPASAATIGGAGKILVYKTNASTQASLNVANADSDNMMIFKDKFWGVDGNNLFVSISNGTNSALQRIVSIAKTGETTEVLEENPAQSQIQISYTGDASAASVSVFVGTKSSGTITVIDNNTDGGETLTIGSTVITEGVDFATGASATETAQNIANAINANVTLKAQVFAYNVAEVVNIEAIEAGSDGDSIALAESDGATDNFQLSGANLTGGSVAGQTKANKKIQIRLSGDQTDGSTELAATALQTYTMKQVADIINAKSGFSATLIDSAAGVSRIATELDIVDAADVKAAAVDMYRLSEEIKELINENSDYIECELSSIPENGLPAVISSEQLTGGAQGASSNSDFSNALAKSLAKDYNVALPLIAQDATDDVALGSYYVNGFVTDAASSYTIASVQASLKTHLNLRSQIKTRKEAQGFCGIRASAASDAYAASTTLASELVQMCMQDVKVLASDCELRWFQPFIQAAMMAGIRLGTEVGEPLTHKFMNVYGVGSYVDMAGDESEQGDFDPNTDYDEAIDNGILFAEQVPGGWRVVVDNTTYGADQSFIWNRGSVIEAAQFVNKSLRETAELLFVGKKIIGNQANSIKASLRSKLVELFNAEILSASEDAPQGFIEDNFVVEISGNTASVQVHIKPVQGLDFVFITFTIGDISQTA